MPLFLQFFILKDFVLINLSALKTGGFSNRITIRWLKTSWKRFASRSKETKYLAADLRKWRKSKPSLIHQLSAIEDQLLQHQSTQPTRPFNSKALNPTAPYDLLAKNEEYHIQGAKKQWAISNRNTTFFHHSIIKRNRKNRITHL